MYPCSFYIVNDVAKSLNDIYDKLYYGFGPQHWWPAESDFETIVGAILTQSVSWTNVEKAINNIKAYIDKNRNNSDQYSEGDYRSGDSMPESNAKTILTPDFIRKIDIEKLAELIRPSGYYNMKARKLKSFTTYLYTKYDGRLDNMFSENLEKIRPELLDVYGIGPETADSILLYAGNYPTFVVDAYTKRIFSRIGFTGIDVEYHELQRLIIENFPEDVQKYNEYHALIVELGKNICKKTNPDCRNCPLNQSL